MKLVTAIFVGILIQLTYLGCAIDTPSAITRQEATKKSLSVKSKIPVSPGKGISFNFDFIEDRRLWNTVNWGQKKDAQFSFSDDLGKTWTPVEEPESFGTDSAITFIDKENGFAVSSTNIVRTTDGGKSWQKLPLPLDSEIAQIKGITFNDSRHGFLVGSTSRRETGSGEETPGMEVLCTNNGGEEWTVCYKTNQYDLIQKVISTKDVVLGLLWETAILRSIDGGQTWERKDLDFKIRDITTDNDGSIWSLDGGSTIRHSENLGESWQVHQITEANQNIRWNSLTFDKNGVGVVVGDRGEIGTTTDKGRSWNLDLDLISGESLWTARIQYPYVAILGEKNLYVLELRK